MSEITKKSDEQKGAEAEVESFRKDLGPFVVAAQTTRMAMVFTDATEPDNPIIFANDSFLSLTGYDREEVLGKSFNFLMAHGADAEALTRIKAEFEGSSSNGTEVLYRRKDGSEFWSAVFISPVRDAGGDIIQYFASFADLTKHKEDQVRSRMLIDELNHRVKNTLSTVQSIVWRTLRTTTDPKAIRQSNRTPFQASVASDVAANRRLRLIRVREIQICHSMNSAPSGGGHRRSGSRRRLRGVVVMEIKVGFEIAYAAVQPTPMVFMLSIHPSRRADIIGTESIVADPSVPIGFYHDSFGNICGRLVAPAGGVTLRGSALVRDSGLPDVVVPSAQQLPIDQLPDDLLMYLMASRYCETDKLTDIAWSLFGNTQPGWARVAAICSFVHNHVTFGYQHADHMKSAHDVYEQRAGVCRDFAHLALTFCRCMGIPARYCTGYMGDIGIPPDPEPMDFSGWFEAYLSGRWYTFDARHNHPRIGRILMGTGRDAADVALTTSFGRMGLIKFLVISEEALPARLADMPRREFLASQLERR